jgi:hypothetical protein
VSKRYRSFEELNIEKVSRLEKSDIAEDDFDELADKVSHTNLVDELSEPDETDTSADSSDTTDDGSDDDTIKEDDNEEDNDNPNEEEFQTDDSKSDDISKSEDQKQPKESDQTVEVDEDKEDDTKKDSEEDQSNEEVAKSSTESFIGTFNQTTQNYIATEDAFIQNCATKLGISLEGSGFLYKNLIHNDATDKDGLLLKLRDLGVEYGKVAVVHVAKGLLFALTKTYEALLAGSKIFIRYSFRMVKNYKRYSNRIKKARELVKLAATKPAKEIKETYNNSGVISTLKIGNDLDFSKNVENLYSLNEHYNDKLIDYVKSNITGIRSIIRSVMKDGNAIPIINTIDHMPLNGFKAGPTTDHIKIMRYAKDLPGDRYFALAIPTDDISEYDDVKKAYGNSKSYITIDDGLVSRTVAACSFLDLRYMSNFLDTLDKLCNKGMELERYFKSIEGYKSKLKPDLESYIKFIVSDKDKMTVKQSLAELVGLKTNFLDRTIISGSMHIHNVNTNVLSSGLTMIRASLEQHMLE